jgi:hypothetical protein
MWIEHGTVERLVGELVREIVASVVPLRYVGGWSVLGISRLKFGET